MSAEITPPSVFDKVVGKAKEVAGAILGDENLKQEGHLHEARAAASSEALKAEAAAAQREEEAEVIARQRELAAESARLTAEELAERDEERLRLEQERAKAAADAQLREHANELHNRDAAKEAAIDSREGQAFQDRVAVESEAARLEALAADARRIATVLDPTDTPSPR